MHPAYSVIVFTTASGAGYGLLTWLGLAAIFGQLPEAFAFRFVSLALAILLVAGGLLSSSLHLGRPERALRAFSQWQTSWLSREAVAAAVTFVPIAIFGLAILFNPHGQALIVVSGLLVVAGALVTVYCTGMIYESLRTVPAWNQSLVTPGYLVIALATGGVLFTLVAVGLARVSWGVASATILLLIISGVVKWLYWTNIETTPRRWTIEDGTGLGDLGKVRQLDPPHTQANFVMREMGYQVARKHVSKLRPIVLIALSAVPAFLLLLIVTAGGLLSPLWATLALASAALGVFVERWLFFAEAQHVVTIYYGSEAA